MAKFCTKCGKPTVDGKCPDCDGKEEVKKTEKVEKVEKKATEVNTVSTAATTSGSSYVNDYMEIVKGIFKTPVELFEKFCKADKYILGIISMVITVVLSGLYSQYLLEGLLKMLGITTADLASGLGELNMLLSALGQGTIDTNIGVKVSIGMAILSAITVGVIWLMHEKVYKEKIDYKKVMAIVGVTQVPLALGLAVSFILTFIVAWLSPIVVILSAIMYFIDLHIALSKCTDLDKNQIVITHALAIIIPAVAIIAIALVAAMMGLAMGTFMTKASMYGM